MINYKKFLPMITALWLVAITGLFVFELMNLDVFDFYRKPIEINSMGINKDDKGEIASGESDVQLKQEITEIEGVNVSIVGGLASVFMENNDGVIRVKVFDIQDGKQFKDISVVDERGGVDLIEIATFEEFEFSKSESDVDLVVDLIDITYANVLGQYNTFLVDSVNNVRLLSDSDSIVFDLKDAQQLDFKNVLSRQISPNFDFTRSKNPAWADLRVERPDGASRIDFFSNWGEGWQTNYFLNDLNVFYVMLGYRTTEYGGTSYFQSTYSVFEAFANDEIEDFKFVWRDVNNEIIQIDNLSVSVLKPVDLNYEGVQYSALNNLLQILTMKKRIMIEFLLLL